MSNATLAAYGRLGSDPREHETRKGGAMATASLAVNVPDRSRDADEGAEATLWLRVTAFGRVAESLARHAKGDPVSVSGRLQFSRYQARDGDEREQWSIVADALVSARTVRPRGGSKPKGDGDGDSNGRGRGEDAGGGMWPAAGAHGGDGPQGDDRYPDARHPPARSGGGRPGPDFDDDIPFITCAAVARSRRLGPLASMPVVPW